MLTQTGLLGSQASIKDGVEWGGSVKLTKQLYRVPREQCWPLGSTVLAEPHLEGPAEPHLEGPAEESQGPAPLSSWCGTHRRPESHISLMEK